MQSSLIVNESDKIKRWMNWLI